VEVNAGKLASTLEKQVFNVDEKPGDMRLNSLMETDLGETKIARIGGLQAPPGL
jgi:hypothetical protein